METQIWERSAPPPPSESVAVVRAPHMRVFMLATADVRTSVMSHPHLGTCVSEGAAAATRSVFGAPVRGLPANTCGIPSGPASCREICRLASWEGRPCGRPRSQPCAAGLLVQDPALGRDDDLVTGLARGDGDAGELRVLPGAEGQPAKL